MNSTELLERVPEQWSASSKWPVELSSDPMLRRSFDVLRAKWSEVPFTIVDRVKTRELESLNDADLLNLWTRGFHERAPISESGWAHLLYKDVFNGKNILDFGSGLGFDSIYFAQHGARVTFVDIVTSNLSVVKRICKIKELESVAFCHLEDLSSLETLPRNFDFVYAEGSLIHAPLEVTRMELAAVLDHLAVGGRLVMLGYPKTRWLREGALPEAEWGKVTDGGAPWVEWLDLDKVMWLLHPVKFEPVLHFELHNSDYNWFDLLRVEGKSNWTLRAASCDTNVQRFAPRREFREEHNLLDTLQPTQPDWDSSAKIVDGAVQIETASSQWAYACIFEIDRDVASDPERLYWIAVELSVSRGEFGVGLLTDDELINERFVPQAERGELFLALNKPGSKWLVLRNTAPGDERSAGTVYSAKIVSEPKE